MASKPPPIRDNTYWYSDLNFTPSEFKNQLWAAQWVFYGKLNGAQFLDPVKAKKYRDLERGIIDANEYKRMIDPVTPTGGGGTAEYVAADFKTCPVDVHQDNIVRAKLDKAVEVNTLQVNQIDKFAKSQKQRDKDKILYQRETRKLINEIYSMLGYSPLKDSENPYAHIKEQTGEDKGLTQGVDQILDYIKSQIQDSQDLALYESYIYKGDIEIAFELGIKHYLINLNKWRVKCKSFNADLLHFNKVCGEWYTDETTGRGTVAYIDGIRLYTNGFKTKNGEDIIFWYHEYEVTFAEFFRRFGEGLDDEQLKAVFELNKQQGGTHGMEWKARGGVKGSNAKIMVGKMSCLTQDADNFSQKFVNGKIAMMKKEPLSWMPNKHTPKKYQSEQEMRAYNVWYSWDYVPPPGSRLTSNRQADWEWQSQYIFNIKKNVDMYRFGVDERYAKSTLVLYRDDRMSFTDIKEAFMPKIRTLWHKLQNNIIQDTTTSIWDQDFLGGLLNAVDEGNKTNPANPDNPTGGTGKDAAMAILRSMKQGGLGLIKMRDKNGAIVVQDPSKLFFTYDSGHLTKAGEQMQMILTLYNTMTMSLAQNDVTEGQDVKPRTPVAGIQASIASSAQGIWFIEDAAREFLIMYGERCVQFILLMVQEKKKYGFHKRFDEFSSVIGLANSMLLESVEDLKPEEIGMTVTLEDVTAMKQYYTELTNTMLHDGKIGYEDVSMIISTIQTDFKYGSVLLSLAVKKKEREQAHKEELEHQRAMELQKAQLQTAIALNQAKGQAKDENIKTQGQVDAELIKLENDVKLQSMTKQKTQLLQNKLDQDNNKERLQTESKTQDAVAGAV